MDIQNLIKSSSSCLEFRADRPKVLEEVQKLEIANVPFNTIHNDISGPNPSTFKGNRYIIALIDSFSKWLEAYSIPNVTSDQIAETLAKFVYKHGCLKVLISGRGTNLISTAIEKVYKSLGTKHVTNTTYRLQ